MVDLRSPEPLPEADFVVMQASLYHFLPDARPIVDRMLGAGRQAVIVSEPVRNLAGSRHPLLDLLGRTAGGASAERAAPERFTEAALDALMAGYAAEIERCFHIPGGREKVFVLSGRRGERASAHPPGPSR